MAIDNSDIIDFIGIDETRNEVILTISDYLGWEFKIDHLLKLQAKINAYLNFIDDSTFYKEYCSSAERKIAIEIIGKHDLPVDKTINEFYNKTKMLLKDYDIILRFKKL